MFIQYDIEYNLLSTRTTYQIKSGGISIEWESGLGNLRLLGVTLQKGMKTRDGAGRMDKRHVSNSDIVLSRYIPVVKDLIQLEAMRNPKLSM